tara:strand:- start:2357 stop:3592 length:1236 start_codon:yes stop_codon:yes gene_type:complete
VHEVDRYLCNKYKDLEWCGILFYTEEGYIDNPDEYKIHIHAMYPMHVGSSASTEIDNYGEVEHYIQARPELDDMRQGFIHSHNNMDTFFSPTDNQQLIKSSDEYDLFLSVITNTEAEYIARVSFPVDNITTKNGSCNIQNKSVGYLDCDTFHEREYHIDDIILKRVEQIDKEHKEKLKTINTMSYNYGHYKYYSNNYTIWDKGIESFEPSTFFEDTELKQYGEDLLDDSYNPDIVRSMFNDYLKPINEFEVSIKEDEAICRCTKEILVCSFNSFGAVGGDQIKYFSVQQCIPSFKSMYNTNKFHKNMKTKDLFELAKKLVEIYNGYSKRVVIESFVNAWQVIHDSLSKDKTLRNSFYNFIYCSLLMYISIKSDIHYDPYSGVPYEVVKYYKHHDSYINIDSTYKEEDFVWY